jgi:hypothetical protein
MFKMQTYKHGPLFCGAITKERLEGFVHCPYFFIIIYLQIDQILANFIK